MTTRRNFLKQSLLAAGAGAVSGSAFAQDKTEANQPKYRLPYKNTYLKEPFVTENAFRTAQPETIQPGTFEEAKQILPNPTWSGHEKAIEMYWKAWQIAIRNIKAPEPGSGFVSSYLDVAYNGNIFMWDSAFMMMFARYGTRFFPFQRTLDNFYAKQHPDGFICREIKADGADCFERYDPTSTGPNIIPWSEIVYYKQFGDLDRLHRIFPALCAYYKWLKLNHTWRNGTYWTSGWGTGMDNMPRVQSKYNTIYSHGHMIWLDVCLQQYFTAGQLLEMGFYIERWQEIEEFEDEQKMLKKYINENLWDEKEHFLFDQYADNSLSTTKGIYAYWALLTDILPKDRLDAFVAELENPETFNRLHRVPSLAANHPRMAAYLCLTVSLFGMTAEDQRVIESDEFGQVQLYIGFLRHFCAGEFLAEECPCRVLLEEGQVVSYHDNDGTPFAVDPDQQVHNLTRSVSVKVSGGFVGKDDLGTVQECPCDSDSLLLAS